MCDDDCPSCGARHLSPVESKDLTEIIGQEQGSFLVLKSSDDAEHGPDYREVDRFDSSEAASAYLAGLQRARART